MASSSLSQSGIYCIRNLVSGRRYVGSAKKLSDRWKAHRYLLRDCRHHSRTLQRSWKKHGEEAFVFEVLELVDDPHQLVTREQFWIDKLHAANPKLGFNVSPTAGNCLGVRHSDEAKAKMSAFQKGKPKSAEHRRAIGDAQKGKIIPEDQRRQRAEATRRHFEENPEARERMREVGRRNGAAGKGRVMSDEMRARNSEAQKRSEKARAAVQRNLRPLTPEERAKGATRSADLRRGRPIPERRALSYLSAEEIRALKDWGATYDELESIFGINRANLFLIVNRRTYQKAGPNEPPVCDLDLTAHLKAIERMRAHKSPPDYRNFGEQHGRCKLSDAQLDEVFALRAQKWSQQRIADHFGVGQSQISRILKGESRQYRKGSYPVDRVA
jgi:group I intron endonuclease